MNSFVDFFLQRQIFIVCFSITIHLQFHSLAVGTCRLFLQASSESSKLKKIVNSFIHYIHYIHFTTLVGLRAHKLSRDTILGQFR